MLNCSIFQLYLPFCVFLEYLLIIESSFMTFSRLKKAATQIDSFRIHPSIHPFFVDKNAELAARANRYLSNISCFWISNKYLDNFGIVPKTVSTQLWTHSLVFTEHSGTAFSRWNSPFYGYTKIYFIIQRHIQRLNTPSVTARYFTHGLMLPIWNRHLKYTM